MGLVFDTCILIADERGRFDMRTFLSSCDGEEPCVSSITASELLHGVERARDDIKKARRQKYVEEILRAIRIEPFELPHARCHARIWADLEKRGETIGPYDLIIAATALKLGFELVTTNLKEFVRVDGLQVRDVSAFLKP